MSTPTVRKKNSPRYVAADSVCRHLVLQSMPGIQSQAYVQKYTVNSLFFCRMLQGGLVAESSVCGHARLLWTRSAMQEPVRIYIF